jgi:CRISPR type IV-associated protein Csf3
MAGLSLVAEENHQPLIVEALLEQGVVVDGFYGLALDGLLASQLRKDAAVSLNLERPGGIDLDGGLATQSPIDWNLPLARCQFSPDAADWHWSCSVGTPLGPQNENMLDQPPDTHRLSTRLDVRRAYQVAVKVPATAGGSSGRFRPRVTPVLTVPATRIAWTAVGSRDEVARLLSDIPAIGARRGAGEGAVLEWRVRAHSPAEGAWHFVHVNPWVGRLSRPLPAECAHHAGFQASPTARAGLRPPLLHPSRQRLLAMPS